MTDSSNQEKLQRKKSHIYDLNEFLEYDTEKQCFNVKVDMIPITKKTYSFDEMMKKSNQVNKNKLKAIMNEFCIEGDYDFSEQEDKKGTNGSNTRLRIERALMQGLGIYEIFRFMEIDTAKRILMRKRQKSVQ